MYKTYTLMLKMRQCAVYMARSTCSLQETGNVGMSLESTFLTGWCPGFEYSLQRPKSVFICLNTIMSGGSPTASPNCSK